MVIFVSPSRVLPPPRRAVPLPFMPDCGHEMSHERESPIRSFGVTLQPLSGRGCQPAGSLASLLVMQRFIAMVCGCGSIGELMVLVNSHSPGSICCACAASVASAIIDPIQKRNTKPPFTFY